MMSEESKEKGILNAQFISECVAYTIYNQGYAQMCNILETILPHDGDNGELEQLEAVKRIVRFVFSQITKDVSNLIKDVLDDWEQEVEVGGELTPGEAEQIRKEYKEVEEALSIRGINQPITKYCGELGYKR
jgi:hypothetical protein